jgi:hypothetical protein
VDMNEYALEVLARERLAELRANRERMNHWRAPERPWRPLRVALGHALIRWGCRLQGSRKLSWTTPIAK